MGRSLIHKIERASTRHDAVSMTRAGAIAAAAHTAPAVSRGSIVTLFCDADEWRFHARPSDAESR
jgi:hypothetical protein